MTDYTPILSLPQVATNQEQKEATINTAIAILEAAMNDSLSVSLAAGDVTLNTDQFTKYFLQKYEGHTVPRVVTIPATPRWFAVRNLGTASVTLQCAGSSGLTAELPSGKIGLLVSDGVDLRFVVPDAVNGMGLLADLSDVSGVPTNNQLLRWVEAESNWKPWTLTLGFNDLNDTPEYNFLVGGQLLAVKADGSGLEWQTSAANVNSFTDLDDTPNSYSGAANRTVVVNASGTGLAFATPNLRGNSDFPSSYTGQAGKFLQINDAANAVQFANPDIGDLTDGPGAPTIGDALLFVRVNAAGTGLEYVPGAGGPVNFTELLDTPDSFVGNAGRLVRVGVDEDQLVFGSLKLTELTDFITSYVGHANKFLRVNGAASGVTVDTIQIEDLTNGPGIPSAGNIGRYIRVNAAGNGLEYVRPALTELSDFPSGYAGQGGKFVQVRPDETGLRFSASSFTASFLSLTDTPDDYSTHQNKMVVVNSAGDGLAFAIPVTTLNSLTDVDVDSATPANGSVLTYNAGAWTAEALPLIATNLNALTDVDLSTGVPADGSVLTYFGGAWTAEPAQAGVTLLSALGDVDFGSGEPAEGMSLVYRSGAWSAEVLASTGGATSLNELTDVDVSTGVPAAGSVLTYNAGVWTAESLPPIAATLNDLTDVDVDSATPAAGSVLTYNSGAWTAEAIPPVSLNSLTDVDVDTTPAANGNVLTYRDGAWTAESLLLVATLNDLSDVDVPAPASGNVLTYRDGEWIAENPAEIGVPAYGSHLYWRLLLHTTDGGPRYGVQELEFKNSKLGPDLANGGTPFASSEDGIQTVDGAFDNVIAGRWDSDTANDGEFIGYQFTAPVEVRYITLKGAQDTPNLSPASFSVQYSDDGITYTTAWEVINQTGWQAGQTREFHGPLGLFFTDLDDAPQSLIGQGGKSLRVNTGGTALELYTPITTLNDLTDVDVDSATPAAGAVLTYNAGAWTAEAIPPVSLNSLTDVDVDTTPAANGNILTYRDGAWTAEAPAPAGAQTLDQLTDVYLTPPPTPGQTLVYNNDTEGLEGWYPGNASATVDFLEAVGDVVYVDPPFDGQVLTFFSDGDGGGTWQPADAGTGGGGDVGVYLYNGRIIYSGEGAPVDPDPQGSLFLREDGGDAYISRAIDQLSPLIEQRVTTVDSPTLAAEAFFPENFKPGSFLVLMTGSAGFTAIDSGWTVFDNEAGADIALRVAYRVAPVDTNVVPVGEFGAETAYTIFEISGLGPVWGDAYQAVFTQANAAPPFSAVAYAAPSEFTFGVTALFQKGATTAGFFNGSWDNDLQDAVGSSLSVASNYSISFADDDAAAVTAELDVDATAYAYSALYFNAERGYNQQRAPNWARLLNDQDGLDALADVTVPAPEQGQVLTYRGGQWIAADVEADYGAHTYWRLNITETTDPVASSLQIDRLRMRTTPGGANAATGGTAFASQSPVGAANAFAGTGAWSVSGPPQTIGYQFPAPVSIIEIEITATNVVGWAAAYLPSDYTIQYSDDGITYFDAWEVVGDPGYAADEVRVKTAPGVFSTFLENIDTPDTYVGQGGKTVKVKADASGLEFVTVPTISALNDLTDVDVDSATPTNGSVLTYADGAWTAEPAAAAGATSLDALTDVDLSTGTPSNGNVLTYRDGTWTAEASAGGGGGADLGDLTITYGTALPTALETSGSLYLQEDAGDAYISNATLANGPLLVQSATSQNIASSPVNVVMPTAPVEGNWLIAFMATNGGTPTMVSGWTLVSQTVGSFVSSHIYRRLAGSGESATVPIATGNTGADPVTLFEVSGLGSVWADIFDSALTSGDSTDNPPFTGTNKTIVGPNGFALALVIQRAVAGTAVPTFNAPWTAQATYLNGATNRQTSGGLLTGLVTDDVVQVDATLNAAATEYGYGVVYFKTVDPYGATDVAVWNKVLLEDRAVLSELADVDDTPASDGEVLTWNATTSRWEAQVAAAGVSGVGEPLVAAPVGTIYRRTDVGQAWVSSATELDVTPVTYSATGARQTYTVTPNITSLTFKMWGGAGGGGVYFSAAGASGAGGYTLVTIPVEEGDVIDIDVGKGGQGAVNNTRGGLGGWPDGGFGTRGDTFGGGGGGSSRIFKNSILMAVAGAGGGGTGYQGAAGAGGGTVGENGATGGGGTQSAGGVDSNDPTNAAKQGAYLQGGKGGDVVDHLTSTSDDGGGGGGGYYGGAGGGGDGSTGGGGSGYINTAAGATGTLISGVGVAPPATTDPNYADGIGLGRMGVASGTAPDGGDGRIYMTPLSELAGWKRLAFAEDIAGAVTGQAPRTVAVDLINPGAEDGSMSGWSTTSTAFQSLTTGTLTPFEGTRHFRASGTGTNCTMVQTVSVDTEADVIDAGRATFSLTFQAGLGTAGQGADMTATLEALDASNGVLTTITSPSYVGSTSAWKAGEVALALPEGTRSVRITGTATKTATTNSGLFDAFAADLVIATAYPPLGQLVDVDADTPEDGDVLTYRDGVWVGAAPVDFGSHTYWRLVLGPSRNNGAILAVRAAEVEMAVLPGGVDVTTGGTPTTTGAQSIAAAFDGNVNSSWLGNEGEAIGYQFPAPVCINEIRYTSASSTNGTNYSPLSFVVQYSDDGITFTNAWTATTTDDWTGTETRAFNPPGVIRSILDPVDTPDTFVGQRGKVLAVSFDESQMEFIDPVKIVPKTDSYTLTSADRVAAVIMNSASDTSVTIPPNATVPFPLGTTITIQRKGAGLVTIQPGAAVTIEYPVDVEASLRTQFSVASLLKTGSDVWVLFGDLLPA